MPAFIDTREVNIGGQAEFLELLLFVVVNTEHHSILHNIENDNWKTCYYRNGEMEFYSYRL